MSLALGRSVLLLVLEQVQVFFEPHFVRQILLHVQVLFELLLPQWVLLDSAATLVAHPTGLELGLLARLAWVAIINSELAKTHHVQ